MEARLTDERPASPRFVPDEVRWNMGWLGRGMSEWRDPDMERP